MKIIITLTIILYSFSNVFSQVEEDNDYNFLNDFLVGEYTIIGKKIECNEAYTGFMKIENTNGKFNVTRQIGDDKIICEAGIKETLSEKIKVFVISFYENNINYEITYLIDTDFDNYPRLSGFLYFKNKETEKPGLEAAFCNH
ncbi:MAG: hypothetical protein JXR51_09920 [Bacteroidales bacterium]|nr:hypothetical protein [Bacteroidales bacterium]